jgi:hypothetical protein
MIMQKKFDDEKVKGGDGDALEMLQCDECKTLDGMERSGLDSLLNYQFFSPYSE